MGWLKIVKYNCNDVTTVTPEDTEKVTLVPDPSAEKPQYSRVSSKIHLDLIESILENDPRTHKYAGTPANSGSGGGGSCDCSNYVTLDTFNAYVADTAPKLWEYKVVDELPSSPKTNTFYMLKQSDGTYEEYVYFDGEWDIFGDSSAESNNWNSI